jgi:hypothetical protein
MVSIAIRRGGSPPPPSLGDDALRFSCALAVYKPPPQQKAKNLASPSGVARAALRVA